MNQKRWQISRRTMLKGMGVAMGLPLLEAMGPLRSFAGPAGSAAAIQQFPVRTAVLYMANGVNPKHWTPKTAGAGYELTEILEPLSGVKDDLLVLTELWNQATNTGDGHYVKTGGFLTGTTIHRTTGSDLNSGGESMDQIMAQRVGNFTPLPSLELGTEPVNSQVDTNVGFTQLYGAHIAWSSPTTPLAKEINPQFAFDRLFRSTATSDPKEQQRNRSVIDLVLDDAKRLQGRVGKADQLKLNEYLDSVRAVERRIEFDAKRQREEVMADKLARQEVEKLGQRIKDFYKDPANASARGVNHTGHVRLMLDIMALAFWTDSTRVTTFMFGNAVSSKNFSFLEGVHGGHHQISHHENKPEQMEQYKLINRWHMQQYAYFLQKLKSIKEGEGNLLDNSMVLMGAGMRDGNQHNPHNLPILLAGRGGGTLSPGRHIVYEKNTQLTNLYRSMLTRMGSPVDKFADSTGELPGLNDPHYISPGKLVAS